MAYPMYSIRIIRLIQIANYPNTTHIFTIKAKAVFGVTLLVSNFALTQDTELPTNTINKSKKTTTLFSNTATLFSSQTIRACEIPFELIAAWEADKDPIQENRQLRTYIVPLRCICSLFDHLSPAPPRSLLKEN
jgi:hypothetical protein